MGQDDTATCEEQAAGNGENDNTGMKGEDDDNKEDSSSSPQYHKSISTGSVDIRVWHHLQSTVPGLN
jgi:hypothetical protein